MIKKETVKNITKLVAMSAASIGSGAIAGAYIATAPFVKVPGVLMKACIWFGGVCIESMVANKTADEASKWVDAIFTTTEAIANVQPIILNEIIKDTNRERNQNNETEDHYESEC